MLRRERRRRSWSRGGIAGAAWLVGALATAAPPTLPPLDAEDEVALAASSDGIDRREEAWHRLVRHVAAWPTDPALLRSAMDGSAIVRRPDWAAWLLDPDLHRGSLVVVAGRLEQATPMPSGGGEVPASPRIAEWFIRPEAEGDPQTSGAIQAWVVEPPDLPPDRAPRRVEVVGRFLRVTELEGRDGIARRFPTIVGVARTAEPPAGPGGTAAILLVLILVMTPIFLWLLRRRRTPSRIAATPAEPIADEASPRSDLPADPAEALGVLEQESGRRKKTR